MSLADITDSIAQLIDDAQNGAKELLEPTIRIGVTGLSRAGKTVFITSLIANMLDRTRLTGLKANPRIAAAFLQPQPDDTIPRFAYEQHLEALSGPAPHWPASTSSISQLRLSVRIAPSGFLRAVKGQKTLHIDIVDYPGEWLLDLPLLKQSYAEWSAQSLRLARTESRSSLASDWLARLAACTPDSALNEPEAQALAAAFTAYLRAARKAGFSNCAPGRFLLPGDLKGSPALTFAPLPRPEKRRAKTLYSAFERRFEAYKKQVVKPFFREHFARIDRQIVLVDALGAIDGGPEAVDDLRLALRDILLSFRPGKNNILSILTGRKVEKILFAATKADHIHHRQHPQLTGFLAALLSDAKNTADWKGAGTAVLSLAALRATVEQSVRHEGEMLDLVRGILLENGKEVAVHPGELPADPARLLIPAKEGAAAWPDDIHYRLPAFAPPIPGAEAPHGLAHIRMDKAIEFLIGDKL